MGQDFFSRGTYVRESWWANTSDHGGGRTTEGEEKLLVLVTSLAKHAAKTRCRRRIRQCVTITKMEACNEVSSRTECRTVRLTSQGYPGLWTLEYLVMPSYPRTGRTVGFGPESFTMITVEES
jgi:hypothetical protein